jgi:hypothetical protein
MRREDRWSFISTCTCWAAGNSGTVWPENVASH